MLLVAVFLTDDDTPARLLRRRFLELCAACASGAVSLLSGCAGLIKPGGHLIITVPSPIVDHLVRCLRFLRVVDGMRIEDHYGFKPSTTPTLFPAEVFSVHRAERFQLGLNHLFVFTRQNGNQR